MNLKKIRNILCIAVLLIAAAGAFVLFAYPRFVEPVVKYNEAQSLYESGDYLRAAMQFSALGGKRDSAQKAADAWCSAGEAALARGDAETAYACFKSAGMPEAEQLRQDECFFELGKNAYAAGDYNRAEICFDSITDKAGLRREPMKSALQRRKVFWVRVKCRRQCAVFRSVPMNQSQTYAEFI